VNAGSEAMSEGSLSPRAENSCRLAGALKLTNRARGFEEFVPEESLESEPLSWKVTTLVRRPGESKEMSECRLSGFFELDRFSAVSIALPILARSAFALDFSLRVVIMSAIAELGERREENMIDGLALEVCFAN
jgi:hypothetical protein